MYHNYSQLFHDIEAICEKHITNESNCFFPFFRNNASHYKIVFQEAYKINRAVELKDAEKITRMTNFLLDLYSKDKNRLEPFKNIINQCLDIRPHEWDEYAVGMSEYYKIALDFQINSGQIGFINLTTLPRIMNIQDPIAKRALNNNQRLLP